MFGSHVVMLSFLTLYRFPQEELLIMWNNNIINRFDPKDRGHNATQFQR